MICGLLLLLGAVASTSRSCSAACMRECVTVGALSCRMHSAASPKLSTQQAAVS